MVIKFASKIIYRIRLHKRALILKPVLKIRFANSKFKLYAHYYVKTYVHVYKIYSLGYKNTAVVADFLILASISL